MASNFSASVPSLWMKRTSLPDKSVAMSAVLPGASKSKNGLPSFSNNMVETWTCASEPLSRKMTVAWSP